MRWILMYLVASILLHLLKLYSKLIILYWILTLFYLLTLLICIYFNVLTSLKTMLFPFSLFFFTKLFQNHIHAIRNMRLLRFTGNISRKFQRSAIKKHVAFWDNSNFHPSEYNFRSMPNRFVNFRLILSIQIKQRVNVVGWKETERVCKKNVN